MIEEDDEDFKNIIVSIFCEKNLNLIRLEITVI